MSNTYQVSTVETTPYKDQKPGTSGLRKRTKVFMTQENYTENFIQSILNAIPEQDGGCVNATLVIGGDGRYYNPEIIQLIFQICAANQVHKLILGQHGILSTPATSHLVRSLPNITGAIILTASHNPGGPENDIGIKYNLSNGAPAPESVTDEIYKESLNLKNYKIAKDLPLLDLSTLGSHSFKIENEHGVKLTTSIEVEIIDSTSAYTKYMSEIFDFTKIKKFLQKNTSQGKSPFCFDALNGVTGPYALDIFHKELGVPLEYLQNCEPKPDFGGLHPDPNLTYAHTLVERVDREGVMFGAASDGDGDRNMIYGSNDTNTSEASAKEKSSSSSSSSSTIPVFISPGDSVAIIAEYAQHIPYFEKNPITGLARSFPTSSAIDNVAREMGVSCYEVPTGWKFFCSLFDAGKLSICGEESFGTGSNHIREKDGLWAVIAWLNILSIYDEQQKGKKATLYNVQRDFWIKYGRNYFTRYDYENVDSESANKVVSYLEELIKLGKDGANDQIASSPLKIKELGDFAYHDIDGTVYEHQGLFVKFVNGVRIVVRLSGTGSQGATIRLYVEKYCPKSEEGELFKDVEEYVGADIKEILKFLKLNEFIGTEVPTVKT
ncbi:hypothetical protein ACO0QE_002093 [Hanseniaspora vineae]